MSSPQNYPYNIRVELGGVTFTGPGMESEMHAQRIKEIVEGSTQVEGVEVFEQ